MRALPIDEEILPPSDDRVFKLILTSKEAKKALIHLLSAVLHRKVVDVEIYANELPTQDTNAKAARFDINCKIDDGSQANVEMQAYRMPEMKNGLFLNIKGRWVFYAADLHSSQLAKGEMRYDKLARTYQITFCTYTIFPGDEKFVHSFSFREDETGELLCDAIQIIIIELSKLEEIVKKPVEEMTDLEKWAVFFQYASVPEYRETVNQVIESEEAIQVAGDLLMSISKNEEERALYRSRKKYQMDLETSMGVAWDSGKEEGLNEGIAKGTFNTMVESIRNLMKSTSWPIDQAMNALNVSDVDRPKYKEILQPQ